MIDRIMRVIKLDFSVFKEIEGDPNATSEAAIVVVVATLFSALGSAVRSQHFFASFLSSLVSGVIGWVVWSAVTYFVGKSMFSGKGSLEGMLRLIGYSQAPQILGILNVIPCVGWIGALAGGILSLIMGVMAVREGLDLDTGQAIIVIIVGAIGWAIVSAIIALIFGVIFGTTIAIFGGITQGLR
jgi:hypothetical protein